ACSYSSIFLCSFFLSFLYLPHLLSFPTRRSSDLDPPPCAKHNFKLGNLSNIPLMIILPAAKAVSEGIPTIYMKLCRGSRSLPNVSQGGTNSGTYRSFAAWKNCSSVPSPRFLSFRLLPV